MRGFIPVQLEWHKVKTLKDDQLEGKSGASSRGNSSSNRIYQSCCSWKARSRISDGLTLVLSFRKRIHVLAACHFVGQSRVRARKCAFSTPLRHWEQIGVLKAGFTALNILAWNDKVWLFVHFVGYEWEVMINRNSCGGTRTGKSEVKFLDFSTTNDCESIYQGCFHWSRTKVRVSKMIRYHRSSHSKRCRLGIEIRFEL
jgi:hypothetical protein